MHTTSAPRSTMILNALLLLAVGSGGLWAVPVGADAPPLPLVVATDGGLVSDLAEVMGWISSDLGLPPPRRVLPYPPRPVQV